MAKRKLYRCSGQITVEDLVSSSNSAIGHRQTLSTFSDSGTYDVQSEKGLQQTSSEINDQILFSWIDEDILDNEDPSRAGNLFSSNGNQVLLTTPGSQSTFSKSKLAGRLTKLGGRLQTPEIVGSALMPKCGDDIRPFESHADGCSVQGSPGTLTTGQIQINSSRERSPNKMKIRRNISWRPGSSVAINKGIQPVTKTISNKRKFNFIEPSPARKLEVVERRNRKEQNEVRESDEFSPNFTSITCALCLCQTQTYGNDNRQMFGS